MQLNLLFQDTFKETLYFATHQVL